MTSASTRAGGLGTPAARWVLVFVWASGVWLSVAAGSLQLSDRLDVGAYLAGLVGALIVTTPGSRPLGRVGALSVPLLALALAVVALSRAPSTTAVWGLHFATYLVALLIVRGNVVAGALGSAAVIGSAIIDGLLEPLPAAGWAPLLSIPLGSVAAAIAWRLVLRHIVRQERAHRSDAARARHLVAADAEAIADAQRHLDGIRGEAGPLLDRLTLGECIDAELRTALTRAEATIRDGISAPGLHHPLLTAELARLRDRGVTVVLLGEAWPTDQVVGTDLAQQVVRLTADVTAGRITVRCLPAGQPAVLSVVRPTATGTEQIKLARNGRILSRS